MKHVALGFGNVLLFVDPDQLEQLATMLMMSHNEFVRHGPAKLPTQCSALNPSNNSDVVSNTDTTINTYTALIS